MIRVGILRGGNSNEYEVSLKSGEMLLTHLPRDRYEPVDILVDRDGVWHMRGLPIEKDKISRHVDVIWNALHGGAGEDGKIAQELEALGIPYTGSGPFAGALGMHKRFSKEVAEKAGLNIANDILIPNFNSQDELSFEDYMSEAAKYIFKTLPPPWIIKPVSGGSSIGIKLARTYDELLETLLGQLETEGDILVEEYIHGKEATVTTLEGFRGEDIYSFLPIEIRKPSGDIFDYDTKYNGQALEISPGKFSSTEQKLLQDYARAMHKALGARHYTRSDFIVSKNGIYFIEINTLPGLTSESLVPKSLEPVGSNFKEFIDHVLKIVTDKK